MSESQYRLSVSQINLFLNEPSIWILNKFYNIRGDMGAAAKRGNAVEIGLTKILTQDFGFVEALNDCLILFDSDMEKIEDEKTLEERDLIKPMLEQATECFLQMPKPLKTQVRHEETIHGVPMLGFADFDMGEFYVDLKTTKRCPSSVDTVSAEHIRQMAYYNHASGKPQKLAYVTDKKNAIYEVKADQIENAKKEIYAACKAMFSCFDIAEKQGVEALTILYPPRDTNSFYWDQKTLNKAQQIWF